MTASATTLAADTNAAYFAKNQNPTVPPLLNAEYTALVENIYKHAEELANTADAAGTFTRAHPKAAEAGLNVPRE